MSDAVAMMVSEENEEPIMLDRAVGDGEYAIVFDPLDGSSNIDVNLNVGTIFSIFRRDPAAGRRRLGRFLGWGERDVVRICSLAEVAECLRQATMKGEYSHGNS